MQFTETVTTLTREMIVPKVYDSILKGNVGLLRLLGNAKVWGTGFRMQTITKFKKSTVGGLVGIGGTLDTSRENTRIELEFDPKRRHKAVVMDDVEIQLNKGEERVLDLLATEMDSVGADLLDEAGNDLYTGTGAGEEFDSIDNVADDGTNYVNYGSQSRTTYPVLAGYVSAGVGTLAIADLAAAWNAVKVGSAQPTVAIADVTPWTAYEGLLQPVVRAGYQATGFPQVTRNGTVESRRALGGEIGFDSLYYRGVPIVEDEKCPNSHIKVLNERYFGFHGIDIDDYEKVNMGADNIDGPQNMPVPRGFNWSGLLRSVNQPAEVGHFYILGNYVGTDPRRQGSIEGITG